MRIAFCSVKWIWALPKAYTRLNYIQSSWTQMIDTWVKICNNDVVEIEFANNSASWYWAIYWVYKTWESSAFYSNWTYYWYDVANNKINTWISVNTSWHVVKHNFINWTMTIDWNSTSFTPFTFTNTVNNNLFSRYYNGSYWYNVSAKIRYCKIIRNWVLILDVVPAKRNSDDVIGMFDRVSQQFLENAGTWDFTWA